MVYIFYRGVPYIPEKYLKFLLVSINSIWYCMLNYTNFVCRMYKNICTNCWHTNAKDRKNDTNGKFQYFVHTVPEIRRGASFTLGDPGQKWKKTQLAILIRRSYVHQYPEFCRYNSFYRRSIDRCIRIYQNYSNLLNFCV